MAEPIAAADLGKAPRTRPRVLLPQQQGQQQGRKCARCAAALGRFYNTGAPCPRCRLRVCRQCREPAGNNNQQNQHSGDWLCSICHKIQDLRSISAEWRRTTGRDNYLSALDILKYSIRRAWTINGPPARWSAARKSAEFRLYRSLPSRSGRRNYLEEAENNAKNNARAKPVSTESPIKPAPRVISSKVTKAEKKSSIPVFRSRNSREFEDIRGPHESPKRSLIPQRYRGSTDDLRRSREDISSPSFIPKLLLTSSARAAAKEDKLRRQDEDHSRAGGKPTPALRAFLRPRATSADNLQSAVAAAASSPAGGYAAHQECPPTHLAPPRPAPQEQPEDAKPEMVDESSLLLHGTAGDAGRTLDNVDEPDEAPRITSPTLIESSDKDVDGKDQDKQRLSDSSLGKKTDEPVVVKRKFSKEELSNDDTDDAPNRRCSSHLSPEASPLSTRSSRYSPRESESEPTPALPRKTTGESSSASQRIRDAITRTRRESNSSAKYESSGSEGVRLSESGISSYVDIARRVKLFGGGSVGFTAANRDEVLQRDSATSAGEDEHDEHARGPASQSRVMLRRRRQFDAQGPRRRGRSHARACYPEDLLPGRGEELPPLEPAALLDYRRLVFISSDSSSGREEDDADSSCSGSSSYLNGQPVPKATAAGQGNCSGLEDCDWDYFESNSLKLPPLQSQQVQAAAVAGAANRDWSCCPARPAASSAASVGCCQACGGSRSAKVLPVPVPIPVPVPYPVPVPASLWTAGEFAGAAAAAAAGSMIGRRGEHSLPLELRGCDPSTAAATWFSWNPSFDSSSLLFAQGHHHHHHHHMFPRELRGVVPGDALLQTDKPEEDTEPDTKPCDNTSENNSAPHDVVNESSSSSSSPPDVPKVLVEEVEQPGRMFRHSQEQDSRSSSGRSSADSSDLEDSAGSSSTHHRFSRVLVVNDDSLTSEDNDVEDNEDSDEPIVLKRVSVLAERVDERKDGEDEPVVLQRIRLLDEDAELDKKSEDDEDEEEVEEEEEEEEGEDTQNRLYCVNGGERAQREIASYDEIYLASTQESSDDLVMLKSVRTLDPDSPILASSIAGYRTFPLPRESDSSSNSSCSQDDDASSDSAVMPDSLEVSMQDLEDSIEASVAANDIARATAVGGHEQQQQQQPSAAGEVGVEAENEKGEAAEKCSGASRLSSSSPLSSSGGRASEGCVGSDKSVLARDSAAAAEVASLMAKSRKKWQIPASFDIKGLPSSHFMPPERKKDASHSSLNPLFSAAVEAADELQPEDEENANGRCTITAGQDEEEEDEEEEEESSSSLSAGSSSHGAHDESAAGAGGGGTASGVVVRGEREQVGGSAPVERRTPTNIRRCRILEDEEIDYHNEDDDDDDDDDDDEEELTPEPARRRDWIAPDANISLSQLNNNHHHTNAANNINNIINNNNKYRSLVMITQQQGAYQPVNVITTDTTTLLMQPQPATPAAPTAYYQQQQPEAARRNIGQSGPPKKPLPCKRLLTNSEPEVDSGLSVGSASESDDVQSVKNASKQMSRSPNFLSNREEEAPPTPPDPEPQRRSGPLILEEGLADDDSWVEEISHDEDEQSATTATEESSEDEAATNLGDREEELRGYHRQAIDFTLHTIVEESCEESESEHVSASWRRRLVSASAPDLDKYYFFGLGNDNGASGNQSSRELDSLSETSSIFSEGLDSISREDGSQNSNQEKNSGEYGSGGPARMEKYFLAEFLGLDQDRRDSDGSVGSDSEGRPSPEAQRRKRLVRARGTGRSHSSSLDNLLALAHSSQGSNSHQNSLQEVNAGTDGQESQSEGSSTETDGADDNPAPAFGTDGQFDTVKRKKKKLRNPGAQSPRVSEDRNKTPEPSVADLAEEDGDAGNSEEDGAKTPQPENVLASSPAEATQDDARAKQQSRDSGFVGSCDDLLLQPQRNNVNNVEGHNAQDAAMNGGHSHAKQMRDHTFESLRREENRQFHDRILEGHRLRERLTKIDVHIETTTTTTTTGLSRKDSFNNWSSDEETNLMMSKMRQFFKTMVANSNSANQAGSTASSAASPAPSPSPRLSGYSSKTRGYAPPQNNRTKPPQLVYFENELTRLMKTVPGIRDEQVREIVEYLSSEDTWSDSYDSSDYTSSDLEGATAGGRRSALQEQISQSCQQIINKFDTASTASSAEDRGMAATNERRDAPVKATTHQGLGRDTAFVYQKLVQSFTKMAGDNNVASDANSTPHSSPPLIAKVMHHIGSRLVALMHEVSESNSTGGHSHSSDRWRRYPHHRTPSSASTTEDDDSTSDSASAPTHLPRSKSHDPLLLINGHAGGAASMPPAESEEREASDYERFSWRGSFESALMAADSRTKLSLLACSTDGSGATAMAAKRRSAGDLLFNPKSFSREQLDRVRSCGSIGGAVGTGATNVCSGSIEEKIWSNRRRSSVPDANTRGESGASAGDEDTEDEEDEDLDYHHGDPRATTLPRGIQVANSAATSTTNSLPRQATSSSSMHKAHSVYHFLPQHSAVKSARYRPPGFTRNSPPTQQQQQPKRAISAPGLQLQSRSRRQQAHAQANAASSANVSASASADEGGSLSEACSTPIIGGSGSRGGGSASRASIDLDDIDRSLHATRASLSSLGARSDSMASVYSGAGEGRWCGSVAVRGEVEFSLQYDYKQLTFEVHVTQCRDLAPVDVKRNRSDPYVKVYLLPDKSKSGKRKTKVKKHTLNPVFDETLKFHTSLQSLESRTLWLTVWHSDMFGRNDFLGEVRMPLENKIFDDPRPQWYPLQERTEPFDDPVANKGEVIVGLKFVPPDPARQDRDRDATMSKLKKSWSKGALHVLVKEARSLQTRAKNSGTCDPFCKSYLLPDKGRSGKQKTGVVRRSTGSPVWNHTFVYKDVSLQELAERGLELTVWDHDRIASNEFLGGVRFNLGTGKNYGKTVDWMDATGREMSLWQSMLERPNFWVEGVVTLRPNLHNHGKPGTS